MKNKKFGIRWKNNCKEKRKYELLFKRFLVIFDCRTARKNCRNARIVARSVARLICTVHRGSRGSADVQVDVPVRAAFMPTTVTPSSTRLDSTSYASPLRDCRSVVISSEFCVSVSRRKKLREKFSFGISIGKFMIRRSNTCSTETKQKKKQCGEDSEPCQELTQACIIQSTCVIIRCIVSFCSIVSRFVVHPEGNFYQTR